MNCARGPRICTPSPARIGFLPELVSRLESAEQRLLQVRTAGCRCWGLPSRRWSPSKRTVMRWRLHFYVRRSLRAVARRSTVMAAERRHLQSVACAYVDRRLAASRRVAGFEGYERLFSLWHALHIPLIFMMIIAAVIHVDCGPRLLTAALPPTWGADNVARYWSWELLLSLGLSERAEAVNPETLLMPGKLSSAHEKYEEQCSLCHDRSDRNRQTQLCLDCHKDIAGDLRQKQGFHGRVTGIEQLAVPCLPLRAPRAPDATSCKLSPEQFDHEQHRLRPQGRARLRGVRRAATSPASATARRRRSASAAITSRSRTKASSGATAPPATTRSPGSA